MATARKEITFKGINKPCKCRSTSCLWNLFIYSKNLSGNSEIENNTSDDEMIFLGIIIVL